MRPLLAATFAALLLAAPAAASGPFMIYFDSGSARLDSVDEAALDSAADWLRRNGFARLRLGASADRAGPAAANRRLARRRGEAVRSALVERGFPAPAIALEVFGEDRPLVDTADGVAERQNRSVMMEFFPGDGAAAAEPQRKAGVPPSPLLPHASAEKRPRRCTLPSRSLSGTTPFGATMKGRGVDDGPTTCVANHSVRPILPRVRGGVAKDARGPKRDDTRRRSSADGRQRRSHPLPHGGVCGTQG